MNAVISALAPKGFHVLDPKDIRDISADALDGAGRLRVMPASYYEKTTVAERAMFGLRQGAYCLPTVELIEWLRYYIRDRRAIEIGSGNGVIADALDIHGTDNKMQDDPGIRTIYKLAQQPTVMYGENVERLEARLALRKYKPKVVIAAWVTHKYDERNHEAGGNMFGVDELDILKHCDEYIFIGNTQVHASKPLWELQPHFHDTPPWLYSRAMNGSPDFVAIWKRKRAKA